MFPALIRAHAQSDPDRPAVVAGAQRLSYAELDYKVSQLRRRLRGEGIGQGHLVGIHLDRTAAIVVAMLAVLAVDAVSWRIIVDDLSRCYEERRLGRQPARPHQPSDFGAWAAHLREHAGQMRADLDHWAGLGDLPLPPARSREDNLEAHAQAVWFGFSRRETAALAISTSPNEALLAAFAQAYREVYGLDDLVVDVESHGRTTFDESVDVSRVVGWFTSTYPVRLRVAAGDVAATVEATSAALRDVPHLGIAYGLHEEPRRAEICYNYLGSLALPSSGELRPTVSPYAVGPVRGADNDRIYPLKLSARVHEGQLIADLSFTAGRHDPEQVRAICRATRTHLLSTCGIIAGPAQLVMEHGSSTGVLLQVPTELRELTSVASHSTRRYGSVLLTGATGFIGVYLLHLLLTRTTSRVHCLVRAHAGASGTERLREAYAWHLPGESLDRYAGRLVVHTADLADPGLGLDERTYDALARETEAVYHLAADTRLFGDRESFTRQNTAAVHAMVQFATTGRAKDLHHVSTLAVSGRGPEGPPVVFSEDSLDVGQKFLNDYERSKYEAERVVHDFVARGGRGFIYRSGNVSGHSRTGRFQRNAGSSRLVQLLRGCAYLGRVPSLDGETLTFSPVDVVAEGILAISRNVGIDGGTFHVESPHPVSYQDLFEAMRAGGCELHEDPSPTFAALFGRHVVDGDEQTALAYFWAQRPERNVRYEHSRTLHTLSRLGVTFPPPTPDWLYGYVTGLIDEGEIPVVKQAGAGRD